MTDDIEIAVSIENKTDTPLKNIEVKLQSKMNKGVWSDSFKWNVKLRPKIILPNEKGNHNLLLTLPDNIHHSIIQKGRGVEILHQLHLSILFPNVKHVFTTIPFQVLARDPRVSREFDMSLEVSKIPWDLYDWTPKEFICWICYKIDCIEYKSLFEKYNFNGAELISFSDAGRETVFQNLDKAHVILEFIDYRVRFIKPLIQTLKNLSMDEYIPIFHKEKLYGDIIKRLKRDDLRNLGIPLGNLERIFQTVDRIEEFFSY